MTIPTFPVLRGREWPVIRTPVWKNQMEEAIGGQRTAFEFWSYPRRRYSLSYSMLRSSALLQELQQLLGFFHSVRGSSRIFQFYDWLDNAVTDQAIGMGDGTTKTFQLVRSFGGFTEPVFSQTAITNIKVAGSIVTAFTAGPLGQITFTSAPANGSAITWTGAFDWLCRFDSDTLDFSEFINGFHDLKKLNFTTEKF